MMLYYIVGLSLNIFSFFLNLKISKRNPNSINFVLRVINATFGIICFIAILRGGTLF